MIKQAEAKAKQAEAKVEQAEAKVEQAEAKVEQAEIKLKQKDIDIARKLKAKGFSVEDISEIAGLSANKFDGIICSTSLFCPEIEKDVQRLAGRP